MFGRKKQFQVPKITTVIGAGTVIKGSLHFEGGIHIDGTIRGNVTAQQDELSTLILSATGLVEGDVSAPNVILNGRVVGNVLATGRVELAANARVSGTLYYKLLEMEMGAEVNGQLVCQEETDLASLPKQQARFEDAPVQEEEEHSSVAEQPQNVQKDNTI